MRHTEFQKDFHKILKYCEEHKLYLGEGNPNSKILLIGKEIGHGLDDDKTPSISKSNIENELNLMHWRNRIETNYLQQYLDEVTALFKAKPNSTWTNYQKIVDSIISAKTEKKKHDFLNHSFITELNQIHLPYSSHAISDELINARRESIEQRRVMFKEDFYQNFPIVIMASGHYPTKDFKFDIEEVFNVRWDQKTIILSKGNYYNIHHGKTRSGEDKILIHTRQASLGVTNDLLTTIGGLCRPLYKE